MAKTSLWSLKKEKWIQGPNLLDSGHAYFENFVTNDEEINPNINPNQPETGEICLVGIGKAMKSIYLLEPLWDLNFCSFSLLNCDRLRNVM